MRIFRPWLPMSTFALVISFGGIASSQSTTQSETTTTTRSNRVEQDSDKKNGY